MLTGIHLVLSESCEMEGYNDVFIYGRIVKTPSSVH